MYPSVAADCYQHVLERNPPPAVRCDQSRYEEMFVPRSRGVIEKAWLWHGGLWDA
jgi:hypothetical protein